MYFCAMPNAKLRIQKISHNAPYMQNAQKHPTSSIKNNLEILSAKQALSALHGLMAQGETQDSIYLAEKSLDRWPNDAPLLLFSARLAVLIGRQVAAKKMFIRARDLGESQAEIELQAMIHQAAPYWHFRMMNDEIRNNAYDQALRAHVKPDSIVLDIGCGAGLLSMMAARAGAEHVYACDMSELIHDKAQDIFKKNGFAKKITSFNTLSYDLNVGTHLPRKADIIVAEVFDSGLLGEEALTIFAHAREELLAPGGKIIPGKAAVQARLIESDLLHKEVVVQECAGFDVATLNELSPPYFQIRVNNHPHDFISKTDTVLNFDFEQAPGDPSVHIHDFTCQRSGLCHGVAFWFTLDFCDGVSMSTEPENEWNCWMQVMSAFETPVNVTAGQILKVKVTQTLNRITFSLADS